MRGESNTEHVKANATIIFNATLLCTALAMLSGCASTAKDPGDLSASQVKSCPNGHATLHAIPVSYGLQAWDRKTEAAFKRGEFWPGVCVIGPGSSSVRITCKTCGYGCNSTLGMWDGRFESLDQCIPPFSPLMAGFPLPAREQLIAPPVFGHIVLSNRCVQESIRYSTKEPFAEAAHRLDEWFQAQNLKTAKKSTNEPAGSGRARQAVSWSASGVRAELELYSREKSSQVWIRNSRYSELFR